MDISDLGPEKHEKWNKKKGNQKKQENTERAVDRLRLHWQMHIWVEPMAFQFKQTAGNNPSKERGFKGHFSVGNNPDENGERKNRQ